MRFPETLSDDLYRVEIFSVDNTSQGIAALRNSANQVFQPSDPTKDRDTIDFKLSLGSQVVAVVPQPVTRVAGVLTQARNKIEVYFNDDDLYSTAVSTGQVTPNPSVVRTEFYQLMVTKGTVRNTDDLVFNPTSVAYDPAQDRATLTFAADLDALLDPGTGQPIGNGTFRLRLARTN